MCGIISLVVCSYSGMVLVVHLGVKAPQRKIQCMSLREGIVNSEEVMSFYCKYTLEDGSVVCLDSSLVSEQV